MEKLSNDVYRSNDSQFTYDMFRDYLRATISVCNTFLCLVKLSISENISCNDKNNIGQQIRCPHFHATIYLNMRPYCHKK